MTSFKITNDDVGLRGLQEKNKTPVVSGPLNPEQNMQTINPQRVHAGVLAHHAVFPYRA